MIRASDVDVRAFTLEDLPDYLEYFYGEANAAFRLQIGIKPVDPSKAELIRERITTELKNAPLRIFTVFYLDQRVGVHTATHLEPGLSLIMHAHFFRPDLRGKGIGVVSYVKALERFFSEFGVKEVLFKTPLQNKSPMRIKEKLGMKPIGEEIIDWEVLSKPLATAVYRVTPEDLPRLRAAAGF